MNKVINVNDINVESAMMQLLDGRSICSATLKKIVDPLYVEGTNKTVDALRYLYRLPNMMDETLAVKLILSVARHRALGWKSLANMIDVTLNHSDDPTATFNTIITKLNAVKIPTLRDGDPENHFAGLIASIVFEDTGKNISEGAFASKTLVKALEKQKQRSAFMLQILNRIKRSEHAQKEPLIRHHLATLKTNDLTVIEKIVTVLLDETPSDKMS